MRFEFDPAKSAANKAKHGIDFVEAQALWNDPRRIEGIGRTVNEPRFHLIGMIEPRIWSAFGTYRHDNETIRLISVRPARRDEKVRYHFGD